VEALVGTLGAWATKGGSVNGQEPILPPTFANIDCVLKGLAEHCFEEILRLAHSFEKRSGVQIGNTNFASHLRGALKARIG
jgi:hypothetical protein